MRERNFIEKLLIIFILRLTCRISRRMRTTTAAATLSNQLRLLQLARTRVQRINSKVR